jgi:hypothetical protein
MMDRMMDRIVVTNWFFGIFCMQVCAEKDATDEEILLVCNRENVSGTTNGWVTVIRDGEGAPVVCNDDPRRLHILVAC